MENKNMNELEAAQLDTVSGGVIGEVADDSVLLHKLGLMDEEFGVMDVTFDWKTCSEKVDSAWAKIGITCYSQPAKDNAYFYKGHPITNDEAKKIAKDLMIKGPKIGIPLPGQNQ